MPLERLCRHHAHGAVPAAAFSTLEDVFHGMAIDIFINIVQLAKKIETIFSDVIELGWPQSPSVH